MLKSWSKLEKILLFGSIILVSAVGIIFKSDILTTICSIVRNNDSTPEWQMMNLGMITNQDAANIINQRNNFKYEGLTYEFLNNWYKVQIINRDVVELAKKNMKKDINYMHYQIWLI